jgi:hypothetical protein
MEKEGGTQMEREGGTQMEQAAEQEGGSRRRIRQPERERGPETQIGPPAGALDACLAKLLQED